MNSKKCLIDFLYALKINFTILILLRLHVLCNFAAHTTYTEADLRGAHGKRALPIFCNPFVLQ